MADWRKMAMSAILSDGAVDEGEVKILQKELKGADGKIDKEGIKFLLELRVAAQKKAKGAGAEVNEVFEKFFFKTITDNVLKDGKIDNKEAGWLRANLFADGKIDDREWAFITAVNKKAKTKSAEFTKLYEDCEASRAKAAKK